MSLAATPDSEHLERKVKVLSRCEDVIKLMIRDPQPTGRLTVKKLPPEVRPKTNYESPLRISTTHLSFTTTPDLPLGETAFSVALNVILRKAEVLKEVQKSEVEGDIVETVVERLLDLAGPSKNTVVQLLKDTLLENSGKLEETDNQGSQCLVGETCSVDFQVQTEESSLSPKKKGGWRQRPRKRKRRRPRN